MPPPTCQHKAEQRIASDETAQQRPKRELERPSPSVQCSIVGSYYANSMSVPLEPQAQMDCLTTPAILSTDVGTFIDDSFAIALLLAQKPKSLNSARAFNSRQKLSGVSDEHTFSARQLDLQLLVTAGGSPLARARVAARFLTRSGHANIPIGLGAPSTNRSGALFNWAEEFDLSRC
eukprot:6205077-Pleurochrysis_carterae.AAC.1